MHHSWLRGKHEEPASSATLCLLQANNLGGRSLFPPDAGRARCLASSSSALATASLGAFRCQVPRDVAPVSAQKVPAKAATAAAVYGVSLLSLNLHVRHGGAALLVLSATTGRVVDIDGRSVQRSMSLYKFYYYNRLVL